MSSLATVGYSGYSGSSGTSGAAGLDGTTFYNHSDFRLTLESGVFLSGTNQEAKTTVYMTPYLGNQICLYYSSAWRFYDSAEISASLSGLTANKNFDVFAYYTGSAVALELVEWTNDSTRATGLGLIGGVYVKSGDVTRKFIGTIRTTGITGQCEDSFTKRFVWNMQNRIGRWGFTTNTNASWTYSTYTWREWNGGSGQIRFEFVLGLYQAIELFPHGEIINASNSTYSGPAVDTTTSCSQYFVVSANHLTAARDLASSSYYYYQWGYHYVTMTETVSGGTTTTYGYGSTTGPGFGSVILLEN